MVDKLYIMLPAFQVKQNYDIKEAWDDFYTDPANADIVDEIDRNIGIAFEDYKQKHPDDEDIDIDLYIEDVIIGQGIRKYKFSDKAQKRFSEWFETRKAYYKGSTIEKLKYDYNKPAHQQKPFRGDGGKARRNNALIDMMWGILTNPDTASKILTPGGFDKQSKAARIVTILDAMTEEQLSQEGYTAEDLLRLSIEKLDKLAEKYKRKLDPLSPRTQVILHQQNMTGAKMIGIYANHNANHALMQHTSLALDDRDGAFWFAGVKRKSLHSMKNDKGEFISRNTANFLAGSVDNVKDNTLHATNQNTFTGDASMLLSRLGYNPAEIAILMRQPIIMEMTRRFFRESRSGKTKETVIKETIKFYADKAGGTAEDFSWESIKNNKFPLDILMRDIQLNKGVGHMSQKEKIDFYRRQAAVGALFQRIMKSSQALSDLTAATRADTQNGGAGPTIAATMIKIQKVKDFINDASKEHYPLIGTSVIEPGITYNGDIDELRTKLLNSPLPFLQAFYTLGVEQTERMLSPYFPHFGEPFMRVLYGYTSSDGIQELKGLRDYTKTDRLDEKTINSIYNDLFAYIMSKIDFFGGGKDENGSVISVTEKRRFFINNFPRYFKEVIAEDETIANLEFIKRLKVALHNVKSPVDTLYFKNVGSLTSTLRERYMRDWASLLYMNNPKAQKLGLGLFLYNYYRNGFAFGPSTFNHLAPIVVRAAIDGYITTLRDLLTTEDNYDNFIEQYIYNHLDDRRFVPEITDESTTEFTDSNNKVLDTVVITIDSASGSGDMAAVKKELKDEHGVTEYEFMEFIGKRIGNNWYYYRRAAAITDTVPGNNSAVYARIEPLGYKYNFLEYEYGKDAPDIETVIAKNKKDYDPNAEYAAQHTPSELTEEDMASAPVYDRNYSKAEMDVIIGNIALGAVYEEAPAPIPEANSITDIEPNTSYRDANDQEICGGAITVAKF